MAYTVIDKPSDYFNTVLYTGTGAELAISGVGFQPDWTWIKIRNESSSHEVFDSVRGATKTIQTNQANAEATIAQTLKSFDSDGFTLGTDGDVNYDGSQLGVAWNWKAGGTASSNTDGDITSSVSANTTSGFSIVKYTGNGSDGATVGHGLGGAVPKLIIYKELTEARNWYVFTSVIDGTYDNVYLNLTDANTNRSITLPTSSLFSLSTSNEHNASSQDYIAYCFAEVKGYSKFGKYTANDQDFPNSPFISTGFQPAMVIIKNITSGSAGSRWLILDNKRSSSGGFNIIDKRLNPNESTSESSGERINFLSNGFKLDDSGTDINYSTNEYIYAAFAESPFTTSTGIPGTAR